MFTACLLSTLEVTPVEDDRGQRILPDPGVEGRFMMPFRYEVLKYVYQGPSRLTWYVCSASIVVMFELNAFSGLRLCSSATSYHVRLAPLVLSKIQLRHTRRNIFFGRFQGALVPMLYLCRD